MCEVTRENFDALKPEIEAAIKDATFIAFDCEFSGLNKTSKSLPSYLDSPEDRYSKLKEVANNFFICQIGLSAFQFDGENGYVTRTFNVYLYPHFFGPCNSRIMLEAAATEFLCNHNFDFNKVIYSGIPFLNKQQEALLQACHKSRTLSSHCNGLFIRLKEETFMTDAFKQIETWLQQSSERTLDLSYPGKGIVEYLFLSTVEMKFFGKFSYTVLPSRETIRLTKFDESDVCSVDYLEEAFQRILKSQEGFSSIIQCIIEAKTPIIGHNCLADLMFLFQKFIKPLPGQYGNFKEELHVCLPLIYDTKFISYQLRKHFKELTFFDDTRLADLYKSLDSHGAKFRMLFSPVVRHGQATKKYVDVECPHEAGYDAFMTGYVFLRMAHYMATKDFRTDDMRPLPPEEHFRALEKYKNCIPAAKYQHGHVNLAGEDPPPKVIVKYYVSCKSSKSQLTSAEVANEFAVFGSADVKLISKTEAVVGLHRNKRNENIELTFKRHKKFNVRKYNPLLHSKAVKRKLGYGLLLVVGVTLTAVLCYAFSETEDPLLERTLTEEL